MLKYIWLATTKQCNKLFFWNVSRPDLNRHPLLFGVDFFNWDNRRARNIRCCHKKLLKYQIYIFWFFRSSFKLLYHDFVHILIFIQNNHDNCYYFKHSQNIKLTIFLIIQQLSNENHYANTQNSLTPAHFLLGV
jgi:hypothetical protein